MSEDINTTPEVWKTISEAPDYSVSNYGQVRRDSWCSRRPAGGLLKQYLNKRGYLYVSLCNGGVVLKKATHRLVAQEFLSCATSKPTVNHKNGIKHDNHATNLEWASYGENNKHAYDSLGKLAPRGEDHTRSGVSELDVITIRQRRASGEPLVKIAKDYKIGARAVSYITNRQTWRHV